MNSRHWLMAFCAITLCVTTSFATECGDANTDGTVDIVDVMYMFKFLYQGGIPPSDPLMADMDDHQRLTIVDAALLLHSFFSCDIITPPCPPDLPPFQPMPDNSYRVVYSNEIPANQSNVASNISLISPYPIWSTSLPLRIRVFEGSIPTIDSVSFPLSGSAFSENSILASSIDNDSGDVILAGLSITGTPAGRDKIATVYLSLVPDVNKRTISIDWVYLKPEQIAVNDSTIFPLVAGYCEPGFRPELVGTCCNVAGDVNDNGVVNITDVVWLITGIFSEPHWSCDSEADANGNGIVNIADAVYLVMYIFSGGPAPVCGLID